MGYTQTIILNYLRGAGPSTVEAIARTLAREERIGRSAVRACLCRMRQAGMIDRPDSDTARYVCQTKRSEPRCNDMA